MHCRKTRVAPVDIPYDLLMSLKRNDELGINWDEIARNLTSDQRKSISLMASAWDWGIMYDISRNLEETDREGIAAVIASGIPVALEELLTYDLDLSDGEFEKIRQSLKQSGWRDLSEKDIREIRTSLQTSDSWTFND